MTEDVAQIQADQDDQLKAFQMIVKKSTKSGQQIEEMINRIDSVEAGVKDLAAKLDS